MTEDARGGIDGTDLLARARTASRPLCDSSEEEFE
jgi:hypothetical protein